MEEGVATTFDFWVGATDVDSEGDFYWSTSGQAVEFTAWSEGQPDGGTNQNCVASTLEHYYFWSDEDCSRKTNMQAACSSNVRLGKCPTEAWKYIEEVDRCYYVYMEAYVMGTEAAAICDGVASGSYPAELETPEENSAVQAYLTSLTNPTVGQVTIL